MTLGFTANSNYKDASGNIAGSLGSPASLQDSALPQVISVATADTNANGKIDKITASFSENVSGNDSGWVISGLATGSSYAGGAVASGNSIAFTVSETSLASDSSTKPTLAYTPGNIQDSSSNPLASFTSKTASDGVAPIILSRKNSDTDGNGRIDHITLQTSETLSGSTASMVALVASHTVSGLTLSGTDIIATISEGTDPDTGDIPSIQLTSIGNVGDTA